MCTYLHTCMWLSVCVCEPSGLWSILKEDGNNSIVGTSCSGVSFLFQLLWLAARIDFVFSFEGWLAVHKDAPALKKRWSGVPQKQGDVAAELELTNIVLEDKLFSSYSSCLILELMFGVMQDRFFFAIAALQYLQLIFVCLFGDSNHPLHYRRDFFWASINQRTLSMFTPLKSFAYVSNQSGLFSGFPFCVSYRIIPCFSRSSPAPVLRVAGGRWRQRCGPHLPSAGDVAGEGLAGANHRLCHARPRTLMGSCLLIWLEVA